METAQPVRSRRSRTAGRPLYASTWLPLLVLLLALPGRHGPDSPVADAAMQGDAATVRALLAQGADVNEAQGDGMTALHWAARNRDADVARTLLEAGADVGAGTRIGHYTPLHLASRGRVRRGGRRAARGGGRPDGAHRRGRESHAAPLRRRGRERAGGRSSRSRRRGRERRRAGVGADAPDLRRVEGADRGREGAAGSGRGPLRAHQGDRCGRAGRLGPDRAFRA